MIIDVSDLTREQLIEAVLNVEPKYVIFKNPLVHSVSYLEGNQNEWVRWRKDSLKTLRASQLEKIYNFCINPDDPRT